MTYQTMSNEDAAYYAKTMTEWERKVIALCSKRQSWGYSRLAEKTGISYADVRQIGHRLQSMNLASVEPVRLGREFNGSAIFLNERGEQVRLAVKALGKRQRGRK